ncbi:MAG: two pore domain potassium channel family protein [Candidatus Brocadiales bacterium]|nr:two pore domain potassium channel family protein [Candidatus Brocadiales bacterium]
MGDRQIEAGRSLFIYYSFVTIPTLGYGDMSPIKAPANSFSFLEAVTGQLYIAILIARLVGIHIAQSMNRKAG